MRTLIKFGVWGVYFLPYSDHRPIDVVKGQHPRERSGAWTRTGEPSGDWFHHLCAIAQEEYDDEVRWYDGRTISEDALLDEDNWEVRELPSLYRNPDGSPAVFVNVYRVGRSYGGPEEGGWSYDVGEPECSYICQNYGDAMIVRERLRNDEYPVTGKRALVRGGPDYEIMIEADPGSPYPSVRPRYE